MNGTENDHLNEATVPVVSSSFRDRLEDEVAAWVEEGLVGEAQAEQILARYETTEAEADGAWTRTLLYATAAVLFGAAAIALVFVGIDPDPVRPYLAGLGAALVGIGVGVHVLAPERDLLSDALLAAALAPLALAPFEPGANPGAAWAYGSATLAVCCVYLVRRHRQPFLPTLTVVGFTAAAGGTTFTAIDAEGQAAFAWLAVQCLLLVGLTAGEELGDAQLTTPVALATVAFAGSLIPFLLETVGLESAETVELVLGGFMLAVLGAGIGLEHRGLLVGAALALGVDAIAFAFTVGGVWTGIGVLVGLAVVLIWQAEHLQAWVRTGS